MRIAVGDDILLWVVPGFGFGNETKHNTGAGRCIASEGQEDLGQGRATAKNKEK